MRFRVASSQGRVSWSFEASRERRPFAQGFPSSVMWRKEFRIRAFGYRVEDENGEMLRTLSPKPLPYAIGSECQLGDPALGLAALCHHLAFPGVSNKGQGLYRDYMSYSLNS